jgi:hypothetical protein
MTTDFNTQLTALSNEAKRALRSAAIMLAALVVHASVDAGAARAGTWVQVSCPDSPHATAPAQGWVGWSSPDPGKYSETKTTCGSGGPLFAELAATEDAPTYASETLEFKPPAGSTLAGGTLHLATVAAGHGTGAHAEVTLYAPGPGGTPFWSCSYEVCPEGNDPTIAQIPIPTHTGGDLYITAQCVGAQNAFCQEGDDTLFWTAAEVWEAQILLENDASPSASNFGGPVLSGEARGTEELDLTATDPDGPGVYNVAVEIDGHLAYTGTPDINGGACVSEGTTGGALRFDSAQPCKQTEILKVPVNTTGVLDGQHSVSVVVTDAAHNTATLFAGNTTTHNAPLASTAPAILDPNAASVGAELTSNPGQWSAPPGTGTIADRYQWEQCSPVGTECHAIPGATAPTYTPSVDDTGHALQLAVTGLNTDGQSTATSATTGLVAASTSSPELTALADTLSSPATDSAAVVPPASVGAANGTPASESATIALSTPATTSRSYSDSAMIMTGHLIARDGAPIARATLEVLGQTRETEEIIGLGRVTTAANGGFTFTTTRGPSRVVEIAYRAFANETGYAALAKVQESVSAGVTLTVSPRLTRARGLIRLSGRVQGPLPHGGVRVAIEVHYLGHWVSFSDPRTNSRGDFRLSYRFRGAVGRFPFRVSTSAGQTGLAFSTGFSPPVDVTTR